MAVKQIYVSKGMETFWTRAEAKAKKQGVSFAVYLGRLVRKDVIGDTGETPIEIVAQMAREAVDKLAHLAVPDDAS